MLQLRQIKKGESNAPYAVLIIAVIALIITSVLYRTILVSTIEIQFHMTKNDIITKVLQPLIIRSIGFLSYHVMNYKIQKEDSKI